MTDTELADFLGIADCDPMKIERYLAAMPYEKRAMYERMAEVILKLQLWEKGLAPKPEGVIVCREHRINNRSGGG